MTPLVPWQNFYVILGSAAGGLTGLQFVTMALIAETSMQPADETSGQAFSTPTIVHFVCVLLIAGSMVMPWNGLHHPAILWGFAGVCGAAYMLLSTWRMAQQRSYKPVFEDWFFRSLLPLSDYLAIAAAAACAASHPRGALFGIAGSVALLLAIGIHNAWDNVTYIVFIRRHETHSTT